MNELYWMPLEALRGVRNEEMLHTLCRLALYMKLIMYSTCTLYILNI